MQPIVFEIPLPTFSVPLALLLFGLAGLGALALLLGFRQRARDLQVMGAAGLFLGVLFGLIFRGRTYTVTSLPVYSYGTLLCASLVGGWLLSLELGRRDGLSRERIISGLVVATVSALAGARLLYVLSNLSEFHSLFDVFALRRGGLSVYGALIAGFAGAWLYLRRESQVFLQWADACVPSVALGLLLGRLGCYLFGCDFGRPLSESAPSWLKALGTFPRWVGGALDSSGSPAWVQHVRERGLSVLSEASLPVHPTQLYEALLGAMLLAFSLWLRRVRRFAGEVFLLFTLSYAVGRFLIETLRDDLERGAFGPALSPRTLVALGLLLLAIALVIGPLRSIPRQRRRFVSYALAILPALVAFFALGPAPNVQPQALQPSTSQWLAVLSALAAAFAYHRRRSTAVPADNAPVPHPAQ